MRATRGSFSIRLLFVAVIGLFVIIGVFPESARATSGAHETQSSEFSLVIAEYHGDRSAEITGHCDPALDCFTANAFLMSPVFPEPVYVRQKAVPVASLQREGRKPLSTIPPPRLHS